MGGGEELREKHGPSLGLLEELLNGARTADEESWRTIVGLYAPFTLHWCRNWGMQPCDAEDVVQEVFLAAAQSIHRFHIQRDAHSFRDWLRGIARNKMLEFRRQSKKREQPAIDMSASGQFLEFHADGIGDSLDLEFPAAYLLLLSSLLESVRAEFEVASWQAFWRTMVDERTSTETAAELGMSPDAVRMCKHRILRRLKQRATENSNVLREEHTSAEEVVDRKREEYPPWTTS